MAKRVAQELHDGYFVNLGIGIPILIPRFLGDEADVFVHTENGLLGVGPPPADDELDEVWPVGDLELFSDLGLPEDEMEEILDDLDALPDEMLDTIVERLGIAEEFSAATAAALAGR